MFEQDNIEMLNSGLVDNIDGARVAADMFKREDGAIIFLYV